jgi:tripartite-type tricarboxylate transporter receptor subunit TctC
MAKFSLIVAAAAALLTPCITCPQAYPSRPIRLILPSVAGGAPDIAARPLASELSKQMGQQVVVDNRSGASGIIAFETIARAAPDGYSEPDGGSMSNRLSRISVLVAGLLAIACEASQTFPVKPLRIVVPFASGSGSDNNPRFYGELLRKLWGQSIVVDNRPGGSGIIAVQVVKGAAADGYTLLVATTSVLSVNPVIVKDLSYDPIKDFRPVILFGQGTTALIVGGASSSKTVRDLLATAKKPGSPLAMGTYSAGYELISVWFGITTGLAVTQIPYKGAAQVMTDVIGGQIPSGMVDFSGALPFVKEGRLRALAITSEQRHPVAPEVPTMKESGFPDFINYTYSSIFVRSETPDPIVDRLHEGFRTVMASPEGRAYQAARPGIYPDYTPQQIRDFVANDVERFRKIAQAAGIKPR